MKFRIKVKDEYGEWWEDHDKADVCDLESAGKKGREIVDYYNSTRQPRERIRQFVEAELGGDGKRPHDFRKVNLMTILKGGRYYDVYRCINCGCEGKRHGLGSIQRDRKWAAKKWESCPAK